MDLVIVRHAKAEDRIEFAFTGQPDDLRPLTTKGRRTMARAARGLVTLVPELDVLASSPLVRARQTADIVSEAYGGTPVTVIEALDPEADYEDLQRWLREQRPGAVVAVVGHEPHLSGLASWFLARDQPAVHHLRKGAACLIRLGDEASPRTGTLEWMYRRAELSELVEG